MSERLDLDAVQARADEAYRWATTDPVSLLPVDFVPLSTREHYGTDVPALVAEVRELRKDQDNWFAYLRWRGEQDRKESERELERKRELLEQLQAEEVAQQSTGP